MKKLSLYSFSVIFILLFMIFNLNIAHAMGAVTVTPSAGGNGTGAVTTAGGVWDDTFSGFRISVLDYSGEPAFTFEGKDSLDLLFTYPKQQSYYGYEQKTGGRRHAVSSFSELQQHTRVLTIADIAASIGNDWDADIPGDVVSAKSRFTSLPPALDYSGGGWYNRGTEIKSKLYGDSDKDIDDDAALYLILNLRDSSGFKWRPKGSAYFGANPITTEEVMALATGKMTPAELMGTKQLFVSIEPIVWNQLRLSRTQWSKYSVYGTQTDIGYLMNFMIGAGMDFAGADAKETGGCDETLFGKLGRRSMVTTLTATFPAYRDGNRNVVNSTYTVATPSGSHLITNDEVNKMDIGWAIQLYLLSLSPPTHTWDMEKYPDPDTFEPHPSPDPQEDPCTKDKSKEKERHYNIIKFYEYEMPSMPGSTEVVIQHVSTHERNKTLPKINIMDEIEAGGYEVVEWKWSTDPKAPVVTGKAEDGATPWDDMISSISCPPEQKSTDETRVGVVDITKKNADGTLDKEAETLMNHTCSMWADVIFLLY